MDWFHLHGKTHTCIRGKLTFLLLDMYLTQVFVYKINIFSNRLKYFMLKPYLLSNIRHKKVLVLPGDMHIKQKLDEKLSLPNSMTSFGNIIPWNLWMVKANNDKKWYFFYHVVAQILCIFDSCSSTFNITSTKITPCLLWHFVGPLYLGHPSIESHKWFPKFH